MCAKWRAIKRLSMESLARKLILCMALAITGATAETAKAQINSVHGFIDFNAYPSVEVPGDNVFTINIFALLPNRFSYFSLTNFSGQPSRNELSDAVNFYTEQNLRYALPDHIPFDLTVQWNMRSSTDNDRLRLGTRWKAHKTSLLMPFMTQINLTYTVNYHYQIDHSTQSSWQLEHVYRIKVMPGAFQGRVYLAGFGDQTFQNGNVTWVTEHQLGIRLVENLYAIAEYRLNEYRTGTENSSGLGFEYVTRG